MTQEIAGTKEQIDELIKLTLKKKELLEQLGKHIKQYEDKVAKLTLLGAKIKSTEKKIERVEEKQNDIRKETQVTRRKNSD